MTVYILHLEGGKYYVGHTKKKVSVRVQQHMDGEGSAWTKKHPPVRLLRSLRGNLFAEEKYTLMLMAEHGIDNVRGGSYASVMLGVEERKKATQQIRAVMNQCYKCGRHGHVSAKCTKSKSAGTPVSSPSPSSPTLHLLAPAYPANVGDGLDEFRSLCMYDESAEMYVDDEGRYHDI